MKFLRNLNKSPLWFMSGMLMVFLMVSLMGPNQYKTRCDTVLLTSGYDEYWTVGKGDSRQIDLSFNRDAVTSVTTATMTLEFCTRETTASCDDFDFDTDADGLGDTNTFTNDPDVIETSGLRGISGFNYLRITQTGTLSTATAEFTICRKPN